MKAILPEDELRKYLNDEQLKRYTDAIRSFYSPESIYNPESCYGVIDTTLRLFLPKDCPEIKELVNDLVIKRHRILVRIFDQDIKKREELMENASDMIKSSLADNIEVFRRSKEFYRQEAIRKYGVEIPS